MMTNAQAQNKMCPFISQDEPRNCEATGCMAWKPTKFEKNKTHMIATEGQCKLIDGQ